MTITILKRDAEAKVAQYPQYRGHFDNYVLVRVRKRIRTKMGVAFEAGEVSIANPAERINTDAPAFGKRKAYAGPWITVWSARNSVDTSIKKKDLEIIGA